MHVAGIVVAMLQRILLFLALTMPLQLLADESGNASVVRKVSGHYQYTAISDGADRGEEAFQLIVHPDGSRTMMIWHDLAAKDAQFSVLLRTARNFRPLSAYVSYWVENGYKGQTLFTVNGDRITARTFGPSGEHVQVLEVPEQFSIGTHPVSADGWHLWYADKLPATGAAINLFSVEASADLDKPMLGTLVAMPVEIVGDEVVETPAGSFNTTHFRLMGATDLWVTGEDRLLVRMVQSRFDREYLLTELHTD